MADYRQEYNSYQLDEPITIQRKDYYCDRFGFPNKKAFYDFVTNNAEREDFYLIAVSIDLTKPNDTSQALGDYALRRFVLSMQDFLIFHIQGEKFNILATQKDLKKVEKALNLPNERYEVFYGVSDEPIKRKNTAKVVFQAKERMYDDRRAKKPHNTANIIGNLGNTPDGLKETKTRKNRSTMWYVTGNITLKNPYTEVKYYMYVTDFAEEMRSLPVILVLDEFGEERALYGNAPEFYIERIGFGANAHFNRKGALEPLVYCNDRDAEVEITKEIHSGNCIPANFGKRINPKTEIYPVKANPFGLYEYVLLDTQKKTVSYCKDGIIKNEGIKYGVHQDEDFIDLIEQ